MLGRNLLPRRSHEGLCFRLYDNGAWSTPYSAQGRFCPFALCKLKGTRLLTPYNSVTLERSVLRETRRRTVNGMLRESYTSD